MTIGNQIVTGSLWLTLVIINLSSSKWIPLVEACTNINCRNYQRIGDGTGGGHAGDECGVLYSPSHAADNYYASVDDGGTRVVTGGSVDAQVCDSCTAKCVGVPAGLQQELFSVDDCGPVIPFARNVCQEGA